MSGQPGDFLHKLLYEPRPDVDRIINAFIVRFNAAYGDPVSSYWDITKEEWQRYEFLGDRVLNLIVAQSLFTRRGVSLSEGEMTQILAGVVSNRALGLMTRRFDAAVFSRLIPPAIGEQETYGERITGGAFEAFIGALYCEAGLDDVTFFVASVMEEVIESYDPRENAIGRLQEYFQKRRETLPVYEETARTGPDHRPEFTVSVRLSDGRVFSGTGPSLPDARRNAAQKALDALGRGR